MNTIIATEQIIYVYVKNCYQFFTAHAISLIPLATLIDDFLYGDNDEGLKQLLLWAENIQSKQFSSDRVIVQYSPPIAIDIHAIYWDEEEGERPEFFTTLTELAQTIRQWLAVQQKKSPYLLLYRSLDGTVHVCALFSPEDVLCLVRNKHKYSCTSIEW